MTEIRNTRLLVLRPDITTEPAIHAAEMFQNETLRPILKLQNGVLINILRHYIDRHKSVFSAMASREKEEYVTNALRKDHHFRHFMRGFIAAHFTESEWAVFILHETELNKRMIKLLEQRLLSQLDKI